MNEKPELKLAVLKGLNFDGVRKCLSAFNEAASRAVVWTILAGEELRRLHRRFEGSHGGDRRSSSHGENLKWADVVKAETGLSQATSYRYMELAEKAEKNVKKLKGLLASGAPVAKVMEALEPVTEGKSIKALLAEWAEEDPEEEAPAEGGGKKLGGATHNKGRGQTDDQALAEEAEERWQALRDELSAEVCQLRSHTLVSRGCLGSMIGVLGDAKAALEEEARKRTREEKAGRGVKKS